MHHEDILKTESYHFDLPDELIAQTPLLARDASRLMVLDKASGKIQHKRFYEIIDLLNEGDCLILNDSRVLPARIYAIKEGTGARVEFLLLSDRGGDVWEVLAGPGRRAKPGSRFVIGDDVMHCEVLEVLDSGNRLVRFAYEGLFYECLEKVGQMPLPHYIHEELTDNERYQTIYARENGSAAAPTAGLHFTSALLERLGEKGIGVGFVTLHVGLGTFRPVNEANIQDHKMHSEHYMLPEKTAELIRRTRANGGRVIAVGTTSCRTIESVMQKEGMIKKSEGWTDIFIYPGYSFQGIDGMITNFHLPESTLIMLVSALAGKDAVMAAYEEAVREKYRFFSFGDAMFIL